MALDLKRTYAVVLGNAYQISCEKIENGIGSLDSTTPLGDPKNKFIVEMQWVELTGNEDECIDLYRVMPTTIKKDMNNNQIRYSITEALCTLGDAILFDCRETESGTAKETIQLLLNKQKAKHWVLKKCDFSGKLTYGWKDENELVKPLFSVLTDFEKEYLWQQNTEVYLFELSLAKPPTEPVARTQEGYNVQGFGIERNPRMSINRICPLGSGEGISKVNIRSVNQGVPYLENKAAIGCYGLSESIWAEQRFSDPKALKRDALRVSGEWTRSQASQVVTAANLTKLMDQPLAIDHLWLDTVTTINTNEFGSINLRVKKEGKKSVFDVPQDIQLELGDLQGTIHSTMTVFSRKQEINETYAQRVTTLLNRSIQRELSKAQPMELNLYFGEGILYTSTTELTLKTTAKGPSYSVANTDLVVDSKKLPQLSLQQQRLNVLNYLRKVTDKKIERDNHTLQFFSHQPLWLDVLVICRVYIQSQLDSRF